MVKQNASQFTYYNLLKCIAVEDKEVHSEGFDDLSLLFIWRLLHSFLRRTFGYRG